MGGLHLGGRKHAQLAMVGVAMLMAIRNARPLQAIADDLLQVGQFHLLAALSPRPFIRGVAVVAALVDRLKASLPSFGRYLPADVVRALLVQGE